MYSNERGLTLVEILAALVILGIVFIGFMTIFPQMSDVNKRTEAKLVTMNSAKEILVDLKANPSKLSQESLYKKSTAQQPFETYSLSAEEQKVLVDCYDFENRKCSSQIMKAETDSLHKIHIMIEKDEKVISEIFGYVEFKKKGDE